MATAFPDRTRGDRVHRGTSARGRGPLLTLILTLDPTPFPSTPTTRYRLCHVVAANIPERLCHPIQFLRIECLSLKLPLSLLHRYTFLELTEPVEDHVDLRGGGLRLLSGGLEHEESLAVGRDVIVRDVAARAVIAFEQ